MRQPPEEVLRWPKTDGTGALIEFNVNTGRVVVPVFTVDLPDLPVLSGALEQIAERLTAERKEAA